VQISFVTFGLVAITKESQELGMWTRCGGRSSCVQNSESTGAHLATRRYLEIKSRYNNNNNNNNNNIFRIICASRTKAGFVNIHTFMGDCRPGFGLEILFIDHLQIVTTSNYIAITNFHTLQITTAHAKSFQSLVTSRSLVTASNSGDSSASALTSLPAGSQLYRISLLLRHSIPTD
jgi:hypothetical protein